MLTKTQTNAVVDAFLEALTITPYPGISLRSVAQVAKVPLAKVLLQFSTRLDLVDAFARRVDEEVLAGDDPDMAQEPARERLFDVLMRRYDALMPHKLALIQLERDARRDPMLALALGRIAARSMVRMAASADLDVEGARGALVLAGLLQVHGRVMRVWLKEGDAGQALTMAQLDKVLRQAERRMADMDSMARMMRGEGGPDGGPLCRLRDAMRRRSGAAESGSARAA